MHALSPWGVSASAELVDYPKAIFYASQSGTPTGFIYLSQTKAKSATFKACTHCPIIVNRLKLPWAIPLAENGPNIPLTAQTKNPINTPVKSKHIKLWN